MRSRLSPSPTPALALVCLAALAVGCSQDVGLIDRTQPGLLKKSIFVGDSARPDTQEWFVRRTVVDVPYDVGYTFIGETEEAYRIRWDIQRDQLVADAAESLEPAHEGETP